MIGAMVDRSNSERLRGFGDRQTDRWMDICYFRVAFATETLTRSRPRICLPIWHLNVCKTAKYWSERLRMSILRKEGEGGGIT